VQARMLTHYDANSRVRMVDVSAKPQTVRTARAEAFVKMSAKTLRAIPRNPKGSPLEVARIAGISAAKKAAELIPLCHPLLLTHIDVQTSHTARGIRLTSTVRSTGATGVEMEALTAVAVAALTVYDMCKAAERGIEITEIRVLEKTGGKSGTYRRDPKGNRS
jgi:cyclic pyranopterin monophosphate synthase